MPDEEVEFSQPKAPRPAKDLQISTGYEASGRVSPETSEKKRAVSNRSAPNWEEPTNVTPLDNLSLYNEASRHYAWKAWAMKEQKNNWRLWLLLILEEPNTSKAAKAFAIGSAVAILLQVVAIMFESGSFEMQTDLPFYNYLDLTLSILFTIELILRTACATKLQDLYTSVFWWIDLLGVIPFYLNCILNSANGDPFFSPESTDCTDSNCRTTDSLRGLLRLLRIVRVLKVMRNHPDSEILFRALKLSWRALIVPFTFLVVGAIFFGSFVFWLEKLEADLRNPLHEEGGPVSPYEDIGHAVWFMMVTFSTVGYGDVSPVTHAGKVVTSMAIIMGLVFMAMPLQIVGANFSSVWEDREKTRVVVRIQEHFIDNHLSIMDIEKIFNEADLDNTGVINLREFSVFLSQMDLQPRLSPSAIRALFGIFDETRSGFINFFEFCHVVFPDLDVERLAEQGSLQLGGALVDALAADHEGYEELADHLRDGSASHRPDSPNRPPLSPAASGTAASKPPDAGLQRDASFGSEASRSAQESVSKSAGEATPSAAPSPVKQGLLACYRQGSMRGLQQHHSSHNVAGEAREERVARAAATGASGLLHLQLERAILNAVESSEQRIMTRLKAHHEKLGARLKRIEDDLGSILDLEQPSAVRRAQKQLKSCYFNVSARRGLQPNAYGGEHSSAAGTLTVAEKAVAATEAARAKAGVRPTSRTSLANAGMQVRLSSSVSRRLASPRGSAGASRARGPGVC